MATREERVKQNAARVYNTTRFMRARHSEYLDLRDRLLLHDEDYQKLSGAKQRQIIEYLRGLIDSMVNSEITWYVHLDERLIPSSEVPNGRWPDVEPGKHVWREDPTRIWG